MIASTPDRAEMGDRIMNSSERSQDEGLPLEGLDDELSESGTQLRQEGGQAAGGMTGGARRTAQQVRDKAQQAGTEAGKRTGMRDKQGNQPS